MNSFFGKKLKLFVLSMGKLTPVGYGNDYPLLFFYMAL